MSWVMWEQKRGRNKDLLNKILSPRSPQSKTFTESHQSTYTLLPNNNNIQIWIYILIKINTD